MNSPDSVVPSTCVSADPDVHTVSSVGRVKRTILDYWTSFDPLNNKGKRKRTTGRFGVFAGPMARMWRAMQNQERVRVMTRGLREPRAILTGRLVAFDRYWNLILSDSTVYRIDVRSSDLAGCSRPNRTQRRRLQRQARSFRQQKATFKKENVDRPATAPCNQNIHTPMEIGQLLPLDDIPEDTLVWGGSNSTAHHSTVHCRHPVDQISMPELAKPSFNRATQTSSGTLNHISPTTTGDCSSQWVPSITQLNVIKIGVSKARSLSEQPEVKADSTGAASNATTSHRGQLFVRGANVVSVIFCNDQHG